MSNLGAIRSLVRFGVVLPRALRVAPVVVWDGARRHCLVAHSRVEGRPGLLVSKVAVAERRGRRLRECFPLPFWCVGDSNRDYLYVAGLDSFVMRGYAYLEAEDASVVPYVLVAVKRRVYAVLPSSGLVEWHVASGLGQVLRITEVLDTTRTVREVDADRLRWKSLASWQPRDLLTDTA